MAGVTPPREKIAIIGGGIGALTSAYFLTDPLLAGRFEVTVYTMGWRLGGKGASGATRTLTGTAASRNTDCISGSAPTTTPSR